jgi:hypothetical protein
MKTIAKKLAIVTTVATATTLSLSVANANLAQAASLTTTFAGGNTFAGNMFDVTTFGKALKVTSLEVNVQQLTTTPGILDVYTKAGSYVGFDSNAAPWTKVSSVNLNSASPTGTPTFVDISDILLSANTVTGFYVTFNHQSANTNYLSYTNGANTYANSDLKITTGVGKSGTFGGTFSPRTWNGTVNYQTVPEPLTILGTGAAFGFGVILKKGRGKSKKA